MLRNSVLISSSGLGHVARGIEAWAADLANALYQRESNVLLAKGAWPAQQDFERVIPCWKREDRKTRWLLQLLPRALGWRLGCGSNYMVEQTTFGKGLIRFLKQHEVDLVHMQDPHVAAITEKAFKQGKIKTKTILAHGTEEPANFLNQFEYLQHLTPWHLEGTKRQGVWKPTWTAIPNFIDTTRFSPGTNQALRSELGIPADAIVILSVAAIARNHKRIDHLIQEFHTLRERNSQLPIWLVVAGGWEKQTDDLIAEGKAKLGDRVRFLVRYPREKIAELYRAADLFVLCSLFEMMPIALIEALSSGLPCLVHEHPNLQWMLGEGGLALPMHQSGMLAEALGRFANDEPDRRSKGNAARSQALAQFSQEAVVDEILKYYDRVLAS
jgi:1,2-diacylglycerol 3-alpha-glucosyltransferase